MKVEMEVKKEQRGLCDASWSSLAMANELDWSRDSLAAT